MIFFDPNTQVIAQRLILNEDVSPALKFLQGESGLSKVNLSLIRQEAQKLSLDMTENESYQLIINLPPALFVQNAYEQIISTRVSFDTQNETLQNVETIKIQENGTEVTNSTTPIYEEKNGQPVKIGLVTIIDSKAPHLIEGFDDSVPIYNSPDDIPTLTESELKAMQAQELIQPTDDIQFGNPADLSYQETIIEMYKDIHINTVSDTVFKLLLGGN